MARFHHSKPVSHAMTVGETKWTFFLVLSAAVTNTGFAFKSFLPSNTVPKCPEGVFLCTLDDALTRITNRTTLSEKIDVAINTDVIRSVLRLKRHLLNDALAATGLVKRPLFEFRASHRVAKLMRVLDSSRFTLDRGQGMDSVCDERTEVIIPEVGQSLKGQWVLLGGDVKVTTVRCGHYASGPCQTVVNSRCSQHFGVMSLPVINGDRYQIERIKVPCGCTCEIKP